jgi:dienelactone hydrolase
MYDWGVIRAACALAGILAVGRPGSIGQPPDVALGQIVDDVRCAAEPSQSYALYLPSGYSPQRSWSLLLGFHPAARGRAIVETYRDAAEKYGYIVAASNNARNGPWEPSLASARAMSDDLGRRFSIDDNRLYLTGHSGGARVALYIALATKAVAGVIASSAGYPDGKVRKTLPFVVFGTAGTEDFNYIEQRTLDRALTTPHRLAIFSGGHTLPPGDVALEAIEWLELQAMKSGRKKRDEAFIEDLWNRRKRAIDAASTPAETVRLLQELGEDFGGVRDVSAAAGRAAELLKQKDVKSAVARERADDDREARELDDVLALESGLTDDSRRLATLGRLRDWLARCARQADAPSDSPERRRARRLLRTITMGAAERVRDAEYLKLLDQYRPARTGRAGG